MQFEKGGEIEIQLEDQSAVEKPMEIQENGEVAELYTDDKQVDTAVEAPATEPHPLQKPPKSPGKLFCAKCVERLLKIWLEQQAKYKN